MNDVEDAGEWIPALAAVHLIAPNFGGDAAAKAALIERMADGVFEGRADLRIEEADIGTLDFDELGWGRSPHRYPGQREKPAIEFSTSANPALVNVPADFFVAGRDGWIIDPAMTSWRDGLFMARRLATIGVSFKHIAEKSGSEDRHTPPIVPRSEAFLRRAVMGLHFRRCDIQGIIANLLNVQKPPNHTLRGALPANAKPNDYKYEEFAHQAAALVRDKNILPGTAFRSVLPETNFQVNPSEERATRHAFELMYDRRGIPLKN